ncbi:MAG: broad specificity phosphatase PhoE [Bacteroidia bacterium]|jgi:broad specificity phosphatase PhoE
MATIYLIRHGQASFGSENYDNLSDLGRRQAHLMGEFLRDSGIVLDAAYSGDLSRQRETCQLALASQPTAVSHSIDARFNEVRNEEQIEHLLPEIVRRNPEIRALVEKGLTASKDYQKVIDAVFNYWVSPECDDARIQSWADFSGGASDALAQVIAEQGGGKTVGIFSSGGTIATMVAQVLGLTGEQTYQFYEPMMNCSITQLFYNREKVSLSYFNDCSYFQVLGSQLDEELITYR